MNVRPAFIIDSSDPASKAMGEITRSGTAVVVVRNSKYLGLISDRDIRRATADISKEKCGTIAARAPALSPQSSLIDIVRAFFAGRWKALPVIERDRVLGMVTRSDVIEVLLAEKLLSRKKVSDVMSSPVVSLESGASISKAKQLMRESNVRRLIVARDGSFEGILSTFDIAEEQEIRQQGKKDVIMSDKMRLENTPVSSYMRTEVETIEPAAPLAEAAKQMVDHDISALVVLDGRKPVGIVTARDLFETAISVEDEASVFISGLEPSEKELYPEIAAYCKELVDKLKKTFEVRSLSVHIKKHGEKKYSLRARLQSKELITVSASAFSLPLALKYMRDELKTVMAKRKINRLHRRISARGIE